METMMGYTGIIRVYIGVYTGRMEKKMEFTICNFRRNLYLREPLDTSTFRETGCELPKPSNGSFPK